MKDTYSNRLTATLSQLNGKIFSPGDYSHDSINNLTCREINGVMEKFGSAGCAPSSPVEGSDYLQTELWDKERHRLLIIFNQLKILQSWANRRGEVGWSPRQQKSHQRSGTRRDRSYFCEELSCLWPKKTPKKQVDKIHMDTQQSTSDFVSVNGAKTIRYFNQEEHVIGAG